MISVSVAQVWSPCPRHRAWDLIWSRSSPGAILSLVRQLSLGQNGALQGHPVVKLVHAGGEVVMLNTH